MSAAWLLGGVQMSTKSSVSPASRSPTLSCQRASGHICRKVSRRTDNASVAATILMSGRDRHPGKCPFAATLPKPMNAPRSTPPFSVEPELAGDRGEGLIEHGDAGHGFVLADDRRRVDADHV